MPTMDSYPAQTTPNNSDYHIVNDGVSGETKRITRNDYLSGAPLPANTVTTAAITDGDVTTAKIDDEAVTFAKTSGIWWEELGRTTLGTAGDTIAIASLAARTHLKIIINVSSTGGTTGIALRFNGDSGANYAARVSVNGGADATGVSDTSAVITSAAAYANFSYEGDIHDNIAAREKIMMGFYSHPGTAGAGNAPTKAEYIAKWANTSAQITSLSLVNLAGTGDFAIGSEVIVLGHN